MKSDGKRLLKAALQADEVALARLLTWLETTPPGDAFSIPELLSPKQAAFRLGVTGPPGAGKSTLVGRLLRHLSDHGLKVAVLAVDPSSPFSGGAILGDRIRYAEFSMSSNVFIRSLGSRGSLGGLSASAYMILRAFDACDFDIVLIETVGVGQTELDILHVADQITVVLVPESGDSIQAMKAGLMEIADVFLVNKADRPGADSMVREIQISLSESEEEVSVFPVVATESKNLSPWFDFIGQQMSSQDWIQNRSRPERLREEAKALLRSQMESRLEKKLKTLKRPSDLKKLFR